MKSIMLLRMQYGDMTKSLGQQLLLAVGITGGATMACALWLDGAVFQWFSTHSPPFWQGTRWILGFQQLGKVWAPVWLLCLWFWVTRRSRPVLAASLALVLTLFLVVPLKALIGRPRPNEILAAQVDGRADRPLRGHSFPSGDTATIFAITTALVGAVRRPWAVLLWATALAVGIFRVKVRVHYPSDVCAGAAIGLTCGLISLWVDGRTGPTIPDWMDRHPALGAALLVLVPMVGVSIEGPLRVIMFFLTIGLPATILSVILLHIRVRHQTRERSQ